MAKICPLFSGSSGNSTLISCGAHNILIDAGVSAKRISTALSDNGLTVNDLDAVLITHAHIDHVQGLRVLLKNKPIPIISSYLTMDKLAEDCHLPENAILNPIESEFEVANFGIKRFSTMHDSPGSSGYVITLENGEKVAVCTDLGIVTDEVRNAITGARTVLIESNHDVTMLQKGPYTYDLKKRISGEYGHLSNTACANELPNLVKSGAVRFILAHLSRENNLPEIAKTAAVGRLLTEGMIENEDYLLSVAGMSNNKTISI